MNSDIFGTLMRILKSLLVPVLVGAGITVPVVLAATSGNNGATSLTAVTSSEPEESATVTATLTGTQTVTATVTSTVTATPVMTGTAGPKVTICHRTGSFKNPYVEITVSQDALPAHAAHGDIIPAPPEGCPSTPFGTPSGTVTATSTATATTTGTPQASPTSQTITICHATGSQSNPYVLITIDINGLNGHSKHAGDIIPAPPGGCPTSQQSPGKGNGGNGNNGGGNGNGNGGGNGNGNGNGGGNGNGNGNGGGNGQSGPPDKGNKGNQNNHGSKKP